MWGKNEVEGLHKNLHWMIGNMDSSEEPLNDIPATTVDDQGTLESEIPTNLDEYDEVNNEANIEGSVASGIQIAPTETYDEDDDASGQENSDFDPFMFIQLGDRVIIDSKQKGRVTGTVYYRDGELISVMPDGLTHALVDFKVYEDDDGEKFDEDLGVIESFIIAKRHFESFVEQHDLRTGQYIETIKSDGTIDKTFKITKVSTEDDFIELEDESGSKEVVEFGFVGIPLDESFRIIRIRAPPEEAVTEGPVTTVISDGEEALEEGVEDQPAPPKKKLTFLGKVTVAKATIYKEAPQIQQRFPDDMQKIDALNDFLNNLDPVLQKDYKTQRTIRLLVETLFHLKQQIIEYNSDGSIKGYKPSSVKTISELIQRVPVPLGRPVLDVKKKLYVDDSDDLDDISDNNATPDVNTDELFFESFKNELKQIVDYKGRLVSPVVSGAADGSVVQTWANLQDFMTQFMAPWVPAAASPATAGAVWEALSDSEFFRSSPPADIEEDAAKPEFDRDTFEVPGYIPTPLELVPIVSKLPFSYMRAISTTYRKGADKKKQVLLPSESASMLSYLLFPMKSSAHMGTTRSGSLALDSGRGKMEKMDMSTLLKRIGSPVETGNANNLLLLNTKENTLGNILIEDYLQGISIPGLGIGDAFATLIQLGIDSLELTPEIINVLQEKISSYQAQLLSTISRLRDELIEIEGKVPEENIFIDDNDLFGENFRNEPMLVEDMITFEKTNPTLAKSDIAQVAYILRKHADYFQVVVGNNTLYSAKERLRASRNMFLDYLRVAKLLKLKLENRGAPPERNSCSHVPTLVAIRKLDDNYEQLQKLIEFIKRYQGTRDGNWINCRDCKKHLMCVHERMQIQAFLSPKEKETLDKEIKLNFGGPQYQGKYICKNCGQGIQDIGFDNTMEVDDNGKPKDGRAVLIDTDEIAKAEFEATMGVPIRSKLTNNLKFNEVENKYYLIIQQIAERVGVLLDRDGYSKVIDRVSNWVNKFDNRVAYEAIIKRSKVELPDFDVMLGRNTVGAAGLFLLLEIQTKIPSYEIRYTLKNCQNPGFDGYPLDESSKQGLAYIACAISSIKRSDEPWSQTGFLSERDVIKRQAYIQAFMESILKKVISDDMLQQELINKRTYLKDVFGTDILKGRSKDMIYSSFLPEQMVINPSSVADNATIPEVAQYMGNRGQLALAKNWIRQSHILATKTATLIRDSPLIETTCCISAIEKPGQFWLSMSDMPKLPIRRLMPNEQGQPMQMHFTPRPASDILASPPSSLYYRLFLKYCFQGPRYGRHHEPGLTNLCHWCGFQFPTNPNIMSVDTEGKAAIESQKDIVDTGNESFVKLLDKIHDNNIVPRLKMRIMSSRNEVLEEFAKVEPSPLDGWQDMMVDTINGLSQLPNDANRDDIVDKLGALSEKVGVAASVINKRFDKLPNIRDVIEDIANLSWLQFFQVIQTYFIIPFKRILINYNKDSLFIPRELLSKISEKHKADLEKVLKVDLDVTTSKMAALNQPAVTFARAKLEYFVQQLSSLLEFKNKIRTVLIPGGERTMIYIQRAMFYGPVASLINPNIIPPTVDISQPTKAVADTSMRLIFELLKATMEKYDKESLSFNDDELKKIIVARNEKEKANIIKELDDMSEEERAVVLVQKQLGIGRWAKGGTKVIYAYDPDEYDAGKLERSKAGIIDFPGIGPDEVIPRDGRPVDDIGFYETTEVDDGDYLDNDYFQHQDDLDE